MQIRAPENFIGHPIAHAGKPGLSEQHCFDGCARVTREVVAHSRQRERGRGQRGGQVAPPCRWFDPAMKTDSAKLARVTEHKRVVLLSEHKMIVRARTKAWRFYP